MVPPLTLGEAPRAAPPRMRFTGRYLRTGVEPLWDVAPDGQRFAFVRSVGSDVLWLELILHWTSRIPRAGR